MSVQQGLLPLAVCALHTDLNSLLLHVVSLEMSVSINAESRQLMQLTMSTDLICAVVGARSAREFCTVVDLAISYARASLSSLVIPYLEGTTLVTD